MSWWDRSDVRKVDVVTGCFMLVRREAIEKVGMMDEQFFMYGEETDWCYRFWENGWKVMFAPVGEIIHFGGQSAAKKPVAMIVQLRLSILKFINKHNGWPAYLIARFLVALFFAVRLPVWLAIAFIRPAARGKAAIKMKAYSIGVVNALFGQVNS
jgi:GT2 family glycosyltransferase